VKPQEIPKDTVINANKSGKLTNDLIERIDTTKDDPKVKAKIQENEKNSNPEIPSKREGTCAKCLIF